MVGSEVVRCTEDGTWSTPPICHKVNCGPPPVVDNSKRQVSGQSYNDTVKYKCDVGYEMTGDDTIVCQETGYWTVQPDCEAITCGMPPTPDNAGLVSFTGTQSGQTATYQCLPGYTTDDPTYITCQLNGEWSRAPNCTLSPIVEEISCGAPLTPANAGLASMTGTQFGQTATYQCLPGYTTDDPTYIICQLNGTWSYAPNCSRSQQIVDVISCGTPPAPDNVGVVSLTGTQFGQTATYQCVPGYTTDDPTYITCQLNGEWSRAPHCTLSPIVEEVDCGVAPQIESGNVLLATGTEARYSCISGYEMTGELVIECQSNKEWSTLPQCHEVNCGPPPVVDNSKRQVSGHSYNDTVRYECDVGYDMTGDDTIVCQETGYWTVHPDCEVVSCGLPSTPDNAGLVSMTGTQFGQTATYQCLPGYTTDDPTYITCQLNGEWSRAPNCTLSPIVEEIDCDVAPQIDNSIVLLATATEARYTCITGYEMTGEPVIECQSNQEWSALPQCHKVNCGPPPVVDNSKRQVSGHSYNDTVRYECDVGCEMTGDDTIVCQETGYWTVHPDCEEVTCEMPPTPDNAGLVIMTGTQFGQTATYQCLPGYTTDDPLYVTCQLNGEWSHLPNCSLIQGHLPVNSLTHLKQSIVC
ncbi:sushi, von Willebrand factor type A, EGF and pentraxin domain-containing protein 1-like [Watersipora subatra]|uniref:sushi, von Willebrand factor type A, EGF and pentraxin domain-containing protein 1-like n=1 Tax=Watersipora subatra TaxID=2589382 RepID=UPI00355C2D6F